MALRLLIAGTAPNLGVQPSPPAPPSLGYATDAVKKREVITAQAIFDSFRVTFCCLAMSLSIMLINFLLILDDNQLVHSAIHPFPLLQSLASRRKD